MRTVLRALGVIFTLVFLPWQSYADSANPPPFSEAELEQMVAPIALYPDPLVAQILMASTYPLEVVTAARWIEANSDLKGSALDEALQLEPWDNSVKSLATVPQVLAMMNDKLDMTQKLGDAFLGQQKDVLNAIQTLRAKAQTAGNLNSNQQETVSSAPASSSDTTTQDNTGSNIITIEPTDPSVISVPMYDPNTVYGSWAYPDYPPYAYYPPGYGAGRGLAFAAGVAVGNGWGNVNWRHGDLNINNNTWQHDPEHRNTPYRDLASQQKYGQERQQEIAAREAFRGRAEQGQGFQDFSNQDLRPRADQAYQNRSGEGAYSRAEQGYQNRASEGARPEDRLNSVSQNHPRAQMSGQDHANLFESMNHGAEAERFSNRGASSLQATRQHFEGNRGGGGFGGGRMGGGHGGRR